MLPKPRKVKPKPNTSAASEKGFKSLMMAEVQAIGVIGLRVTLAAVYGQGMPYPAHREKGQVPPHGI